MREFDPDNRIVLDVPGMGDVVRERIDVPAGPDRPSTADIYRPLAGSGASPHRPAVLFVHGDADPESLHGITEWGQYVSWGQAVAAMGIVGVTFEHSSTKGLTQTGRVIREVDAMLAFLRSGVRDLGIDSDRIGVWTCSAGTPYGVVSALRASPPVRCLVAYYGFLDLRHLRGRIDPSVNEDDLAAASPAAVVDRVGALPPTLIVKAARDRPPINESIDAYVAAVAGRLPAAQVLVHPSGRHAFDVLDDDDTSRSIITATLEFMATHLGAPADPAVIGA